MVEVVVTIGIVALLLSILLPAIQNSRASARLLQCRSNLHQIGVAFHNFTNAKSEMPTSAASAFQELAPFLEHHGDGIAPSVFACPEDPRTRAGAGEVNYHINSGSEFYLRESSRYVMDGNGILSINEHRPLREISDGLSNTACYSERLCAASFVGELSESELRAEPNRFLWFLPGPIAGKGRERELADACRARRTTPFPGVLGTNSAFTVWFPGYNHFLTPNSPPCVNGSLESADARSPVVPPTSLHADAVSLLLCDGSVRTVSDSIDGEVWRAIGSRDGGEVTGAEW